MSQSDESDLCLSTIRSVSDLHLALSSGHFRLIRSLQPKMFYVQRVRSTRLWDFGAKAERVRTIAALRLARYDGQDGRFVDTLRTWRTDPKMHLERALSLEDTSICVQ